MLHLSYLHNYLLPPHNYLLPPTSLITARNLDSFPKKDVIRKSTCLS
jgi:hypothetical protein